MPSSGYYPGGGQAQEGGRAAQIKQVGVRHNTTIQVKWHLAHREWRPGQQANRLGERTGGHSQQASRRASQGGHDDVRVEGRIGGRTRRSADRGEGRALRRASGRADRIPGGRGQSQHASPPAKHSRPDQMASGTNIMAARSGGEQAGEE